MTVIEYDLIIKSEGFRHLCLMYIPLWNICTSCTQKQSQGCSFQGGSSDSNLVCRQREAMSVG